MARLTAAAVARWTAAAAALALATLLAAPASSLAEPSGSGALTLIVENDLFYANDRDYTNGVALLWTPGSTATPRWAVRVARWLPWFPDRGDVRHGYGVGQNMYTPRDITLADPPVADRPYAGWLYGAIGVGVGTGRRLDQAALTVGVVGPASLARQSQRLVHRITREIDPRGWATQLRNEPGILLTYDRSWRGLATNTAAGIELDLTPHFGGALGNVYTYAAAGWRLRYGNSLPFDYGPPRIQPSLPGSGFFERRRRFSWYAHAGFEGRAVARNIFLDGNTFGESRRVDKEPLVGDLEWGVALAWRGLRLSYTHILRTSEFRNQGGTDQFGAVSLSVAP